MDFRNPPLRATLIALLFIEAGLLLVGTDARGARVIGSAEALFGLVWAAIATWEWTH